MNLRRVPVWWAALAMLFIASTALATSWPPRAFPLSEDDQMDMATSYADAIVIGEVSSPRDSIDEDGNAWRWTTLKPSAWLKGVAYAQPIRVYFPQISNVSYNKVSRADGASCLVILHRVGDGTSAYWVVAEQPDYPGQGILVDIVPDSPKASAVKKSIARVQLDSVTRRSVLIVIGSVGPSPRRITIGGTKVSCSQISVESSVFGPEGGGTLLVYGPYGALNMSGRALLFLSPGEDGAYKLTGFHSGLMTIESGTVRGQGKLEDVVARIRLIKTTGPQHGR